MATEETKPVEREDAQFAEDFVDVFGGFPKDQAIALLVRRQGEIRDAALERAADEADAKLKHFGVGGLARGPVRDAIRALKGSR